MWEKMIEVLEGYYHPSNGGTWTRGLRTFLYYGAGAIFSKRVAEEKRYIFPGSLFLVEVDMRVW